MSLTSTEEAQLRDLIAKQAELLSLATAEPTIISKLGATKKNISTVTPATVLADADLTFVRQGTQDKSSTLSTFLTYLTDKLSLGFSLNASTIGHLKLPDWMGGIIFQWGSGLTDASGVFTGPFSMPFTTTVWSIMANDRETVAANVCVGGANFTNSTFTLTFARGGAAVNAGDVMFWAIGK